MFPRLALVIVAVLLMAFAIIFVRGEFALQQARCVADCNRGIAFPYQQLLARMRQLAENGETDKLRLLIIHAQERSGEMSRACTEHREDGVYAQQVRELTQ